MAGLSLSLSLKRDDPLCWKEHCWPRYLRKLRYSRFRENSDLKKRSCSFSCLNRWEMRTFGINSWCWTCLWVGSVQTYCYYYYWYQTDHSFPRPLPLCLHSSHQRQRSCCFIERGLSGRNALPRSLSALEKVCRKQTSLAPPLLFWASFQKALSRALPSGLTHGRRNQALKWDSSLRLSLLCSSQKASCSLLSGCLCICFNPLSCIVCVH